MIQLLLAVIYLAFISLGLPDSMLGSAWPAMYGAFGVPVSYAGIISMIIALGTIVSSLQSDRLTRKLGAGKVTAISVGMTALALFGFSLSRSFWLLCLWAIPYGLGAGSVDAALNNYVALHYAPPHELAALHVGRGRVHRAVYHGRGSQRRAGLERGLPHGGAAAGGPDGDPSAEPAALE
jgi:MFS family permease